MADRFESSQRLPLEELIERMMSSDLPDEDKLNLLDALSEKLFFYILSVGRAVCELEPDYTEEVIRKGLVLDQRFLKDLRQ